MCPKGFDDVHEEINPDRQIVYFVVPAWDSKVLGLHISNIPDNIITAINSGINRFFAYSNLGADLENQLYIYNWQND